MIISIFIRTLFVWLALTLLSPSYASQTLIDANNLSQDGNLAQQKALPILILFSIDDCRYCAYVQEHVLLPMNASDDYHDKVIIRHINTSNQENITDFDNQIINTQTLADRYEVGLFPTIVIVSPQGKLLKTLIGVSNEEYYWYRLDQHLDAAIDQLKSNT